MIFILLVCIVLSVGAIHEMWHMWKELNSMSYEIDCIKDELEVLERIK